MRSYAIGDIHGQAGLLRQAHALIERDRKTCRDNDAPVIHLGDLVDRGPDSAGVIRLLREGISGGAPWVVLKGNHDRLFARFLTDPGWCDPHIREGLTYLHPLIGGAETLMSYGLYRPTSFHIKTVRANALAQVPPEDIAFLDSCPLMYRHDNALFVHAGIRPGVPLPQQTEQDLLWIRDPFLMDTRDHGPLIVHGHTAIPRPMHYRNRVNLDSRAGYGGPLTAAVIEDRQVSLLTESGRVPLVPR
ncbi:metallophosphoesterase family protein [Roseinatronobacter alkalisoli]|uniref:Metallophosphoesterase family protein n=1 Tax=Roseinatronobacter alkalisoli TaxID=3028235 RepID=A0ABT5T8I5_9RHOB|nr:metallophosphoesterase family protein [Roseinatronobacter sp. HJB301]MDD7970248.1 metallophosphoesterase family protein [Roseinatronobacter sp. HJB301]